METVEQLVSFNHIQVQLSGGAPWGFTLKGGLEHGEPLIITKIEDDGKAELSRKLRVGDELININGSALYGSRQEALILIKGSYRILKITVRRRTVPVIRPHSWHLTRLHPGACPLSWNNSSSSEHSDLQWGQLSRPYSSTDRSSSLGSMESLDAPTPTPRPYGDAHPSPVDSALSKRDSAYSSFSASSNASEYAAVVSLRPGEANSMDNLLQSLGPACRGYPGGDTPVLGRAVGEAPDDAQLVVVGLKSRSLTRPKTRPAVVKDRPSSCCYEEERRGGGVFGRASDDDKVLGTGMNPPRPPTRKDSFRATRSRKKAPDTCPPDGVSPASSCHRDDDNGSGGGGGSKPSRLCRQPDTPNSCTAEPAVGDSNGTPKDDPLERYLNARNQSKALRFPERDGGTKTDYISEEHKAPPVPPKSFTALPATSSSNPASSPPEPPMENQGELQPLHPRARCPSYGELHHQSDPENPTTTTATSSQLQSLHLNGDASSSGPNDRSHPPPSGPLPSPPFGSGCSYRSPLQSASEDPHTDPPLALDHCPDPEPTLEAQQSSWGGSRCSTPGSVFLELDGIAGDAGGGVEDGEGGSTAGSGFSPLHGHHSWGRSASVPGDLAAPPADHQGLATSRLADGDFVPLSAAASVDSLLEEQRGGGGGGGGGGREAEDGDAAAKRLSSSKNLRRHRRRSERFATNLRNEIQRKKAQLQTGRGPGGLLHSGATLHEEEGLELQDQGGGDPGPPGQGRSANAGYSRSASVSTSESGQEGSQGDLRGPARSRDSPAPVLDLTTPSFGVSIRVVEEPAPAGKARRWRWTPEHKLQPELEPGQWSGPERPETRTPGPAGGGSRHGVCAFACTTNSSSSPSSGRSYSTSRIEESEILPFADRMKFFEETSRSGSVSSLCGPRRQASPVAEPRGGGDPGQYRAQRRYSYQGGVPQESAPLPGSAEARRQSVSTNREKEREKEREREREREHEREDRARERQREREERQMERQREKEREERELILQRAERLQAREREREKEREERVREWAREREREERERERQARAREWEREKERERKMEAERLREQREQEKDWLERERRQKAREREAEQERQSQLGQSEDLPRRSSPSLHQEDQPHRASRPHGQAQDQPPRSAFYPVGGPSQHQGENQGFSSRSYTPGEAHPTRKTQEAPKLNRKYSLTERDYPRWRSDSVPLEAVQPYPHPHHSQPQHQHRPHQSVATETTRAHRSLAQRGRAMSENDLRHDASRLLRRSPAASMTTSQILSEVDESGRESGPIRKKVPPPPRPPPPKWEEFHRRRASHHNLYSSPPSSSSSPSPLSFSPLPPYHSIPPAFLPSNGDSSSQRPVEPSRPRSYSLPPERHQVLGRNQDPEPAGPPSSRGQAQPRLHDRPLASPTANQRQAEETLDRPYHHSTDNLNKAQVQGHCVYPHVVANQNQEQNHHRPRSSSSTNQSPEPLQDRLFNIAPPSPMFSRRAFRPVAPPPRERGGASRSQQEEVQENGGAVLPLPPPSSAPAGSCVSSSWETQRSRQEPGQETLTSLPRPQADERASAHWDRKRTPSPSIHCNTSHAPPPPAATTALENGVVPAPERYVTAGYEQQRNHRGFRNYLGNAGDPEHRGGSTEPETEPAGTESEATLSPSPAHSLEAELDIPMETDIDDYQEEEEGLLPRVNPITSEHPCFALPVTAVETDIDTSPDLDASPPGRTRAGSGSLEEGEEEEEEPRARGPGREQPSPLGSEGEWGTESWKGAYRGLGHDTDSLERHSGRSSSCSSHYGVPAARPQISSHRKDPPDPRHHDDDEEDLTYKRQLMESLRKKLGVLREAQRGLQEDIRANTQLGQEVESAVVAVCKPNEVDKFRMFIGDLDKVVSLLLSLSARLLRTQSALDTLGPQAEPAERPPLVEKQRQLMRQLSEAQDLKEHVDRREQAVGRVLSRCLSPDQHRDYCHFVKMKAALLVEQRQLEDKTRLGEEQLRGLRESLDLGLGVGLSLGYGHY